MRKTMLLLFVGLSMNCQGQMPYNPISPYDYIGELHNDLFNCVKGNPPRDLSEKRVLQAMDDCLKEMRSNSTATEVLNSPEYLQVARAFRAASDKEQFLEVEAGYTAEGAAYCSQLFKRLAVGDYETLYSGVSDLERELFGDQSLHAQEKSALLIACAVGRHSAYNALVNSGGGGTDREKVWVADVWGALEGAAAGAGRPPIIIGQVSIPGVIVGAFMGAARGSVMAMLAGGIE